MAGGHAKKSYHATSITAMNDFISSMKNPQNTIPGHLDKAVLGRVKENRQIVKRIAEAVLFCDRQCIAPRESQETLSTEGNPGNFLALLKEMAKTDGVLQKHLSHPKLRNTTYLSPQSRNEIINIIGNHQIREIILKEVRDAELYAIMADEVTSHNSEQLSVCVRNVDKENNVR